MLPSNWSNVSKFDVHKNSKVSLSLNGLLVRLRIGGCATLSACPTLDFHQFFFMPDQRAHVHVNTDDMHVCTSPI